jgi:hypothetical protein
MDVRLSHAALFSTDKVPIDSNTTLFSLVVYFNPKAAEVSLLSEVADESIGRHVRAAP